MPAPAMPSLPVSESATPIIESLRALSLSEPQTPSRPPGSLIAQLKSVNRASNAAATSSRAATTDARKAVNDENLNLQNLMYEKRHLEREIEKCRNFGFIYHEVPLLPVEEFLELAPEELRTPEVLADEHQLMLNRLRFELSERQRLEERRKALVAERDAVLNDTKKFQTEVDQLADPFEKLAEMTLKVQKMILAIVPDAPEEPSAPPALPEPVDTAMQDAT